MTPIDQQAPIEKRLFANAMKSKWKEVINIYKSNPEAQRAKITRSGDTALHIAISDGQESTVEELVGMVDDGALRIENVVGNTPLRLAAHMGNVKMCRCIATRDTTLMGIRNEDKETPLFISVLHGWKETGWKEAFLCLNSLCKHSQDRYGYCRAKDGVTILHAAIDGEYFEIAFYIIRDYEVLLYWVNEEGFSPLHILANKPSAFRSGSHISGFHQLIYYCIYVAELNLYDSTDLSAETHEYDHENPKYPENYQTCIGICLFMRNTVRALMGRGGQQNDEERVHHVYKKAEPKSVPENYTMCFNFLTPLREIMFIVILLMGSSLVERMSEKKKKHVWSVQIMKRLIEHASLYEYENTGKRRPPSGPGQTPGFDFNLSEEFEKKDIVDDLSSQNTNENGKDCKAPVKEKRETPFLMAAKNGIIEMVEVILECFPVAINEMNTDNKNIVLLAVENRQPHIYKFLLGQKIMKKIIFRKIDKDGNSALHLAAMVGDQCAWYTTNAALQLQWEIKWYQYVKESIPPNYVSQHNINGQTPSDILNEHHQRLVYVASKWLKETSQSCSVVAALIATVAFATSATVPGGVREGIGMPTLEHEAAFSIFAISSLVALCFSITSIFMFLAVVTFSYSEKEFNRVLQKLMVGLGSLFISLSAILVSFCAAHFLIMKDQLKYAAIPLYAVIFIFMTCYVIVQFPWYFDVMRITLAGVPPKIKNFFE